MFTRRQGAQAKHQERQGRRVKEALTLCERFPRLKSLTVNIRYHDPDAPDSSHRLKFAVNVQHAKSVLLFRCPNAECFLGGFVLSGELTRAVRQHRSTVTGEMPCPGWLSRNTVGRVRCRCALQYSLQLGYSR
jgi:hypothetical protein